MRKARQYRFRRLIFEHAEDRALLSTVNATAPTSTVNEGNGAAIYFQASPPSSTPITVNYQTVAGTATENGDYQGVSGSTTIGAYQPYAAIYVSTLTDSFIESPETFSVTITSVSGGTIGTASTTITINDVSAGAVTVSAPVDHVSEGSQGTFRFTVAPSQSGSVTVSYRTVGGSAIQDTDYQGKSGNATIPPMQSYVDVNVSTFYDLVNDPGETFFMEITGVSGASFDPAHCSTTMTIDDVPANVPPTVSVANGTIEENEAYTPSITVNTGTAGTSYIYTVDWGDGSSATYGTSDTPSHIYVDDNPTGTSADNYTITVTAGWPDGQQATGTGTVSVQNVAPFAQDDGLASSEGFTTNEDTPFTTASVLSNDTDQSPNDQLSVVELIVLPGTRGTVTQNADGTFNYSPVGKFDWLHRNQSFLDTFRYRISDDDGGQSTATVTITVTGERETYQLTPSVQRDAKEDGQVSGLIKLTLDPPAKSAVTIDWSSLLEGWPAGDDIADDADLVEDQSHSCTFYADQSEKLVELTPVDDGAVEPTEMFYVDIPSVSNNAYSVQIMPEIVMVRIIDDEWRWVADGPVLTTPLDVYIEDERGILAPLESQKDHLISEVTSEESVSDDLVGHIRAQMAATYWDHGFLTTPNNPTVRDLWRELDLQFSLNTQDGTITRIESSVYTGNGTRDGNLTIELVYSDLKIDQNAHTVEVDILSSVGVGGTITQTSGGGGTVVLGWERSEEWGRNWKWDHFLRLKAVRGSE